MPLYNTNNLLFSEFDLDATMRNQLKDVSGKVGTIPRDQFLSTSEETLHEHLFSSMSPEPLILYEDRMEMEEEEVNIDVTNDPMRNPFGDRGPILIPGIKVTVSIPWTGEAQLWNMKTNPYNLNPPSGRIRMKDNKGIGYLDISAGQSSDEPQINLKTEIDNAIENVKKCVERQKVQIEQHNKELSREIGEAIQRRRENLKKNEGLSELLNIPLKRREGAPEIKPIHVKRKLIRPLPPVPKSGLKPEPGIQDKVYEHILGVIRHEGRTFETTPEIYKIHDEEELRGIVMAHLNGHYEGGATGETFRGQGKTDIRIEDQGRAAFIAECKVWYGSKELNEAIGQLLGYLTWRDCKTSIVIFNKKNSKFSELLKKTPEVFEKHPQFSEKLDCNENGEWRYRFSKEDDEGREILIHIFLFDLFVRE